jgi:hypothetical protein
MRGLSVALLVASVSACDSKATASDPNQGLRPEQKSKELESCSASVECSDPLRCFDHECRRVARSTVGDYYAALGAAARDQEAAIAAYSQALGHYEAEKVPLPPEIDCAYGAALVAAKTKKEHAELGARVLHRCLLATPVGSRLHAQAIAQLATLSDAGLDPLTLAKPQLADLYLTKGPSKPATDKLTVAIAGLPQKSNDAVKAKLDETDTHSALITCWQNYFDAVHKDALAVMIPVKAVFVASEYEDEQGVWVVKLDPSTSSGAEAAAESCIRQIVEPILKTTAREGYNAKLAITIK